MLILNEECNLTKDWKEWFKEYKRTSNYPSLQDISNLINYKVGSSQCGVVLRGSYSASYDTSVEVIEVASFIGYINDNHKQILYERLCKKLHKGSHKRKPSLKIQQKIKRVKCDVKLF